MEEFQNRWYVYVKPKKSLGQHFLKDLGIAKDITEALTPVEHPILEIGPGMGVLTQYLWEKYPKNLYVNELDTEAIDYIRVKFPYLGAKLLQGDFLRLNIKEHFSGPFSIIGNFPYNISSQIFFVVLDHKDQVNEVVCMLQKEVAQRLASGPGNKDYGILSVLLQAYYSIEYLFTVHENSFNPPPRVKSGVIRLKRNDTKGLDCDEKKFKQLVKQGFNNRRKTLRNALKPLNLPAAMLPMEILDKRAEQLSVADFVMLTSTWQNSMDSHAV